MRYVSHIPAQPLATFVDYLWSLSDNPLHTREHVVPSGTLELVINLHQDEFRIYGPIRTGEYRRMSGAIVSGAYRGFFVIDTLQHSSIVGVHFKPGGARPFLGISAVELADAHVELETLWGRCARELRERLCTASTHQERFRILEDALVARLSQRFERHPAVRFALSRLARTDTSIDEIVKQVGLSHRRFIELFAEEIGMTPKTFGCIQRFQRAMALLGTIPGQQWSELALHSGYFDQSHMIRDFVRFSGLSPSEFMRQSRLRVKENHVARSD